MVQLRFVNRWVRPRTSRNLCTTFLLIAIAGVGCSAQSIDDLSTASFKILQLMQNGKYAEAIKLGEQAYDAAEKELAPTSPVRLQIVLAFAQAEAQSGNTPGAASLLENEIKPLEQQGLAPLGLGELYRYAANLEGELGRNTLAESCARRAVDLSKQQYPADDPRIAGALVTLAIQQEINSSLNEAFHSLKEAERLASNSPSPLAPRALSESWQQLAILYDRLGDHAKATEYRAKTETIQRNDSKLDPLADQYQRELDVGWAATGQGDLSGAAHAFERAMDIAVATFGRDSYFAQSARQALAAAYLRLNDRQQAKPLVEDLVKSVYADYLNYFSRMNDQQRVQFVSAAEFRLSLYFSYVDRFHDADDELPGDMFDVTLWSKGAVLSDDEALQQRISVSSDPAVAQMDMDLGNRRRRYLEATMNGDLSAHQDRANVQELESQIAKKLGPIAPDKVTWEQLKAKLAHDAVAIQVVHFHYLDRQAISTSHYAALVYRPEWIRPKYVMLGDDQQIENEDLSKYMTYATSRIDPKKPQLQFWTRLEDAIGQNAKTIYISTDGALNNVSFDIIPSQSGELLIDKYDIRIVSNFRSLETPSRMRADQRTAVLVGNPDYNLGVGASYTSDTLAPGAEGPSQQWAPLPDTGKQVQDLAALLGSLDWNVSVLAYDNATKQRFLDATVQPRLLHFATHGFFSPNLSHTGGNELLDTDDAMLNSGLVLAGSNDPMEKRSMSFLSSYEIMSLNLKNTELVVLTACDTGLADTLFGDEALGLRRAFQVAGAESVLMTLWQVPAKESTALVESFYESWLHGADKHSALRLAKIQMRAKSPQPVYWGGFVLLEK